MNLKQLSAAVFPSLVILSLALPIAPARAEEPVQATSDATFTKDVLKASKPVLVDFYADWCGPCRRLSPSIENLAKKYAGKIDFYKLNVDKAPKTSDQFGVNSIPAVKIFKDGKVLSESVGGVSEESIDARLESALK